MFQHNSETAAHAPLSLSSLLHVQFPISHASTKKVSGYNCLGNSFWKKKTKIRKVICNVDQALCSTKDGCDLGYKQVADTFVWSVCLIIAALCTSYGKFTTEQFKDSQLFFSFCILGLPRSQSLQPI